MNAEHFKIFCIEDLGGGWVRLTYRFVWYDLRYSYDVVHKAASEAVIHMDWDFIQWSAERG